MLTFRQRLISALIESDTRQAKRPASYNRYALPLYLQAADACCELVAKGASQENAFAEYFTATREMHRVARQLGFIVEVERGEWYFPQTTGCDRA